MTTKEAIKYFQDELKWYTEGKYHDACVVALKALEEKDQKEAKEND